MIRIAIPLALLALAGCGGAQDAPPKVQTVTVVKSYPHDSQAFTEGLFLDDDTLFESTGEEGTSGIKGQSRHRRSHRPGPALAPLFRRGDHRLEGQALPAHLEGPEGLHLRPRDAHSEGRVRVYRRRLGAHP